MRKRTINHLFDTIFWYIIYLLPIIFLIFAWSKGNTDINLATIFMEAGYGFDIAMDNSLLLPLYFIFSQAGPIPLFNDLGIPLYLGYFISCWIVHLFVDVLLFIVRWAHSMMDGFLGGKHD